jgi:uncharacterized membrane protein
MYSFRTKQAAPPLYAACSDFCESFLDNLTPFYVLAFALTGNHAAAEQCFVATVEDAIVTNGVFKRWERSWSKRRLIINAIRHVFHEPTESMGRQQHGWCEVEVESTARCTINAVARLAPPIQRFVFVISILERYSEHECALLLGRTPRGVREARIDALWKLSGLNPAVAGIAGSDITDIEDLSEEPIRSQTGEHLLLH